MFNMQNYSGCIDKLEAYKQHATDADLIQEADFLLVCSAFEQGRPNAGELLHGYLELYPDSRHADEVCFRIGSVHFGRGEYEKAIYWLEESDINVLPVEEQETHTFRLAYSLLQTGERSRAKPLFERIRQIGTQYKDASAYYVAYIDYADGQYNKALAEFGELSSRPDYKEQSAYYITQILFIQNKYRQAAESGEKLLADYPRSANNTEIYRILGNSYYHLGQEEKAYQMLSRYVESAESPLRGDLYLLGVCSYNQGRFEKAIRNFGKTVNMDDALTQNAYLYLGQAYLKTNDKNNARMAFEAAATARYDEQIREAALYNYALIIHETGFTGFGESVTIFEDFLNDFPNSRYSDKVNDYLVEVYLTTKNYDAALASIEKIKQPSPKILEAKQNILFQLGTQAFANVRMDDAIAFFTQSIQMGNYDRDARNDSYFWRGESYYRKGDYHRAISDFRSFLSNSSGRTDTYALAHYNLGYCYFKQQDYNNALGRFQEYVAVAENRNSASVADAYNRIGDCLFRNRQFAAAEESYSKAAQLFPSAGDYSVYQKGFVLGLQKDYKGKINEMDRLIRDFPESQYIDDAMFEKGRSYVLLGNNAAAAQSFEELLQRYPQSSLARRAGVQLGLIYFNDNNLSKSAAAYKQVISQYPGTEEARVALQDLKSVYVEMNDINAYANYVNSLGGSVHLEITEQDSLTYIAAEKLFMRGDNAGAQRSMQNYLAQYPDGAFSSNANFYLGSIAFSEGDFDAARRYFDVVIGRKDMKFMEEALARKSEIEYNRQDYDSALKTFQQLAQVAENADNKQAAHLGMMRCALRTGDERTALESANELLKNQKLSPEISAEARYVRAKAYINSGNENDATADLRVLSADTRTAHGAEAKYLLAQICHDRGEDEEAEKVLDDFAKNGTPHQYWLARGFILYADIYIGKGDDVQARVYLNSLKNNYKADDDIAAMIEDRLARINKKDNNGKTVSNEEAL